MALESMQPGVDDDCLAIDERGANLELACLRKDRGEPAGPVQAGPCIGARFLAAHGHENAVAVIFHFVEPAIAGGDGVHQLCELDRPKTGRPKCG